MSQLFPINHYLIKSASIITSDQYNNFNKTSFFSISILLLKHSAFEVRVSI